MGINLVTTKLLAFALGASFSGFAGSIFASIFQFIDPFQFDFSISIMVLSMVILGGLGNIWGVIVGGLLMGSFNLILGRRRPAGSTSSATRSACRSWPVDLGSEADGLRAGAGGDDAAAPGGHLPERAPSAEERRWRRPGRTALPGGGDGEVALEERPRRELAAAHAGAAGSDAPARQVTKHFGGLVGGQPRSTSRSPSGRSSR